MQTIRRFLADESGATAIEYGLIAAGIALAIIAVVNNLGSTLKLKFGSISSSLTGATVTQPTGSQPAATINLGAVNPSDGDKVTFNFNLPDGTNESIALTATATNPPPAGSFLIGADTTATTANLQTALTTSVKKLSDTSLVAASAIAASNNFFEPSATIAGMLL